MSGPSRPALRLVPASTTDDPDDGADDTRHDTTHDTVVDGFDLGPARGAVTPRAVGRSDVAGLRDELDADVDRLAARATPTGAGDLRARWTALRERCEPGDLDGLAEHVRSLHEAVRSVRRQHTETAEDLGPLWDTWAGPAAEAVQDRVSALARSAHALVVELETTADRLSDAHDRVIAAIEALADDLAERPSATPIPALAEPWDRASEACARAWDDVRRVLAGGPDVSRS